MKRILSAFGLLVAVTTLAADLEWTTDYSAALADATSSERLVLLEFTGSDWCPPCIALEREVLAEEPFTDFAADQFVLVKLDFPRDESKLSEEVREQNYSLQQKLGIRGYPTVIILDAEGEELSRQVGYNRGAKDRWLAWLRGALESSGS